MFALAGAVSVDIKSANREPSSQRDLVTGTASSDWLAFTVTF